MNVVLIFLCSFIFYYGTTFFKTAGIKNPFTITIITDVVNTVMTVVGVNLIDRVGRRRLVSSTILIFEQT